MVVGALSAAPAALARPAVTPLVGAARQFESIFVALLLREALTTEEGEGVFGKGPGSTVMQGMLEQTLAEQVTRGGGLGIADRLLEAVRQEAAGDVMGGNES